MRSIDDWADRRYFPNGAMAHLVAFGAQLSLCDKPADDMHGTGCMDEIEKAQRLPLCGRCEDHLPREKGSDVDPAVAGWTQAMTHDSIPPREKGTPC